MNKEHKQTVEQLKIDCPTLSEDMMKSLANIKAGIAKNQKTEPESEPKAQKSAEIVQLPLFPEETRPASNPLIRSALFAAIRGKDRQLLNNAEIETIDGCKIIFSGEQFNQDDKDTLMQLAFIAKSKPLGEYVTVPAHTILKALGRGVGGAAHQTLKEEIERLVKGTVKIQSKGLNYIGHFIDDAIQDEISRHWAFRFNPHFAKLLSKDNYTLVDWEQRKNLKNKYLARWLQLELASHSAPFARSVEFYRDKSGSCNSCLRDFRRSLRTALDDLKTNGDIIGWVIDKTDLVHIERTPSPTQKRHIIKKIRAKRPPKI